VTDIKMPGMDGLELLEKIRELRPETPTLLITGHGEHDLAIRALRGGAYEYLQKPIERDAFVAAIRRALQTRHLRRQIVEQQLALELHAKSLEQLVQQRTRELVEANATKDKVISIVSHELKEPLMHLKDMTHRLSRKLEGAYVEELVIQGFADVEQALIRTEVLVQELLETARIDTTLFILHRERYNLVALCQSVLEECTAANHIALTGELPGSSLDVEIDVERIRHLLTLLFSNVCKSLTKNTSVTVTLQQVGHEAMLIVGDISLRPELGVGFYISRKIIERHGGRLDVQYFPGNRCTYFIALPLLIDPSTEDADAVSPAPLEQAVWIISYT
jgi:signal transduction histidine kinase